MSDSSSCETSPTSMILPSLSSSSSSTGLAKTSSSSQPNIDNSITMSLTDDTKDTTSSSSLKTSSVDGGGTTIPLKVQPRKTIDNSRKRDEHLLARQLDATARSMTGKKRCIACNKDCNWDQFSVKQWLVKDTNTCRPCINLRVRRLLWPQTHSTVNSSASENVAQHSDVLSKMSTATKCNQANNDFSAHVLWCNKCLDPKPLRLFSASALHDFKLKRNLEITCITCADKIAAATTAFSAKLDESIQKIKSLKKYNE